VHRVTQGLLAYLEKVVPLVYLVDLERRVTEVTKDQEVTRVLLGHLEDLVMLDYLVKLEIKVLLDPRAWLELRE